MQMLLRTHGQSQGATRLAADAVLGWARTKWVDLVPSDPIEARDFEHDQPGLEIGAVDLPERQLWGFRVEHPDSMVPGRTWLVEAVVASPGTGFDVLGVRSQCCSGGATEVPFSSPRFVRTWLEGLEVEDAGWRVDGSSALIASREEVAALIALLNDPQRELPVVVVTEFARSEFCIDADRLAGRAPGLAHVVRLPVEGTLALTDALGRDRSVFKGAIRTYFPGFGQPDDSQVHAVFLPSRVMSWRGREGEGRGAFQDFLVEQLHRFSVRTPARLEQMPSYLQLRRIKAERELRAHRTRGEQPIPGVTAGTVSATQLSDLRARTQEIELEMELLRLEKEEAEKKAADAETLFEEQAEDLKATREERDTLRATNASILNGLRRVRENSGQSERLPTAYSQVADWVDQAHSDRLVLLSRARRGLKDAVFKDLELVANCLQLLATEYWLMRTADPTAHDAAKLAYERKLSEIGVDEAASISVTTRGQYEDQYCVHYMIGHTSRQVLERHLRGGSNTKDDRYCLRIYFLWDYEKQKVVIGHLPSHLDTRAS